ncbi:MAG: sel1 repeat family protein [Magnetococcales bacterium]|nr:sel1 repeat family protein [Magnetococcales bacterium]
MSIRQVWYRWLVVAGLLGCNWAATAALATTLDDLIHAAHQGDVSAQFDLGVLYEQGSDGQGLEVTPNYQEALQWYRTVSDRGYTGVKVLVGMMHESGRYDAAGPGILQDYAEAMKWYRSAADQGNRSAQFMVGNLYDNGHGVPQDRKEAIKWYRLAADRGNASAQYTLGNRYHTGQFVPQNYTEAMRLYRLAADQGLAKAQYSLGLLYWEDLGKGLPHDLVQAYMWLNLAESQNTSESTLIRMDRERLARTMLPSKIRQAQELAHNWKPNVVIDQR